MKAIDSDSISSHQEMENEPTMDTEQAQVNKTRTFYTIQQKKQLQDHSAV